MNMHKESNNNIDNIDSIINTENTSNVLNPSSTINAKNSNSIIHKKTSINYQLEPTTGIIKWFSIDKGYGFITDEHNSDYHYVVNDIYGVNLTKIGDTVEFIPDFDDKTQQLKAKNVHIIGSLETNKRSDRVNCESCEKQIVPRLIINNGRLMSSICPFCGHLIKQFYDVRKAFFVASVFFILAFLVLMNFL